MERRFFLKGMAMAGVAAPYSGNLFANNARSMNMLPEDELPGPDEAQKKWMELKFGMFIHFGLNTFHDVEWSGGDKDLNVFNPSKLNTDEWCAVAKDAGMKYVVLVAKHHDGFCLWPSKTTNYSVAKTPFKKDITGMLVNSAEKFGLKTGFYYSLWDRHQKIEKEDNPGETEFILQQLDELMSDYGDITEFWFDGSWKKQQSGWKNNDGDWCTPQEFEMAWRFEGSYRWQMDLIYKHIKSRQQNCIVMNNPTTRFKGVPLHPVDALCAERGTDLDDYQRYWNWLGMKKFYPLQIETTMSTTGKEQFSKGSWFWHEWDHSVAAREKIMEWLNLSEKLGANLLLNCGPMATGQLRPEDINVLTNLRN
ncbi:MAG: alpha-L-fucosidase [Bacteroidales bacterium]|nr:alpha-L-fucosidase [Bacteroidales bacterium]